MEEGKKKNANLTVVIPWYGRYNIYVSITKNKLNQTSLKEKFFFFQISCHRFIFFLAY